MDHTLKRHHARETKREKGKNEAKDGDVKRARAQALLFPSLLSFLSLSLKSKKTRFSLSISLSHPTLLVLKRPFFSPEEKQKRKKVLCVFGLMVVNWRRWCFSLSKFFSLSPFGSKVSLSLPLSRTSDSFYASPCLGPLAAWTCR